MIELEERVCPICGRVDASALYKPDNVDMSRLNRSAFSSRKLPEYMHFRLVRCVRCDLIYASPALPQSALADAYRTAAFEASRESQAAAKTYYSYLRKYTGASPVKTLDIGAGDGAFLSELHRHGYDDIVGFEPSEAPLAFANPQVRGKIRNEMFDGSSIDENIFGLVTCFQTIEHVFEPLQLLRDIRRVLYPGGHVFLVGHDARAFSAKVLGDKSPIFDIEHYQLFSRRSAEALLRAAGFHSIAVFPIMNAYPLSYWLKLFPAPEALKRGMLKLLGEQLLWLGQRTLPLPAGNLGFVAKK